MYVPGTVAHTISRDGRFEYDQYFIFSLFSHYSATKFSDLLFLYRTDFMMEICLITVTFFLFEFVFFDYSRISKVD